MLSCVQLIGGRAHDAGVEAVLRAVYGPEVCAPPFAAVCKIVGTIGVPCVGFDVVQAAEQLAAEIEEIFAGFAGSLAEVGGVGRIEEGMAKGAAGHISGNGVLGIGFAMVVEVAAELAALSAHDEAGVLQIELVAVELCCADFVPISVCRLKCWASGAGAGTWYRAARCMACALRSAITACRVWLAVARWYSRRSASLAAAVV